VFEKVYDVNWYDVGSRLQSNRNVYVSMGVVVSLMGEIDLNQDYLLAVISYVLNGISNGAM